MSWIPPLASPRANALVKKHPILAPLIAFFVIAFFLSLFDQESKKPLIGVLPIEGVIMKSDDALKKIQEFKEDSNVKGVIIRINSPGGAVAPSQEIYQEILSLKKIKPVYASISSVGASGGYYIAAAATKIYAMPGSLTGSIGVIMQSMNVGELTKKIGLKFETLKAGKNKDLGNAFRPMTGGERSLLNNLLSETHRQFIADVQSQRSLPEQVLAEVTDGRVLTGTQAKKAGLVDELLTFRQVQVALASELGLGNEFELTYAMDPKEQFLKDLDMENLLGLNNLTAQKGLFYLMDIY